MKKFDSILDDINRDIPDYYDTMYQDGYEPWQIEVAYERQSNKEVEKYYKKKEMINRRKALLQNFGFIGQVLDDEKRNR